VRDKNTRQNKRDRTKGTRYFVFVVRDKNTTTYLFPHSTAEGKKTATHYNILQHPVSATHCNTLSSSQLPKKPPKHTATPCKCNTLQHQHTATPYTLQHTATPTQCNTLQMQHSATHLSPVNSSRKRCNTLQHPATATHCNTPLQSTAKGKAAATLQHTTTPRNIPQHPATHCNTPSHSQQPKKTLVMHLVLQ